jgi:hypothetical protein
MPMKGSYARFAAMIATATVVMYGLIRPQSDDGP